MKAIRIHSHGSRDVLRIDDIPRPQLNDDEVLIRVKAAALNHLDVWVRRGLPGITLPLTMGSDASGVIEEIGKAVKSNHTYRPGDEVFHVPYRVSEPTADDHLADDYRIAGEQTDGVQAEWIAVPVQYILPKPSTMSFEEAAAFPLSYMTAYHMLIHKVNIRPDQWILIWGASSGVGSAAIQIARHLGANIISTAGSPEKVKLAIEQGAQHVINYKEEDVKSRVREITSGKGVQYVFEHIGQNSWPHSTRSLCKGGTIITCGATSGPIVEIDLRHVFIKHQQIVGSTMGNRSDLESLIPLFDKGILKPVIDSTFHFEQIKQAHDRMESGGHFGKIVLLFS